MAADSAQCALVRAKGTKSNQSKATIGKSLPIFHCPIAAFTFTLRCSAERSLLKRESHANLLLSCHAGVKCSLEIEFENLITDTMRQKAWKLNSPSSIAHADFVILLSNLFLSLLRTLESAVPMSHFGAGRLADYVVGMIYAWPLCDSSAPYKCPSLPFPLIFWTGWWSSVNIANNSDFLNNDILCHKICLPWHVFIIINYHNWYTEQLQQWCSFSKDCDVWDNIGFTL